MFVEASTVRLHGRRNEASEARVFSEYIAPIRRVVAIALVGAALVAGSFDSASAASPVAASDVRRAVITPETRDYAAEIMSGHPRAMLTPAGRADLISRSTSDAYSTATYAAVKYRADRALRQATLADPGSGSDRLTTVTAELMDRTTALAIVYLVSGDQAYAERLWTDLDAVTTFRDWDPDLFLSTSGITLSVALAYDWLYDYWTSARREQLSAAIIRLGLQPSMSFYEASTPSPGNWSVGTDNWNLVSNAGMIVGAVAVADTDEATANSVLGYALASIRNGIGTLASGGGYPEGPAYWDYAMGYLAQAVMALRSATGTDYGLSSMDGMADTGLFPLYATGPAGTVFNFGDSNATVIRPPSLLAFAQLYGSPVYTYAATQRDASGNPALRLLWYRPQDTARAPQAAGLALDHRFDNAGVATHRGSWSDTQATGIAIRTGTSEDGGHQDLDAGAFVLDALGENWSVEYGRDTYSLPGYFDRSQNGARWSYLRKRADGQNTLVVDPYTAQPTTVGARGSIERSMSNLGSAISVIDLSTEYPSAVTSWKRGFFLFDGRRQVIVQDELRSNAAVDAIWSMHTRADISISSDGRTATLSQNGRTLVARIASATGQRFVNLPAEPLPNTAPASSQSSNAGARRLAIQLTVSSSTTVTVQFSPREPGTTPPAARAVTPLASWALDSDGSSRATGIRLAGIPLRGFSPEVLTYHSTADPEAIPSLTATAPSGASVETTMPNALPGVATVSVTESGKTTRTYRIFLEKGPSLVSSVTAELTKQGSPEMTVDGDATTYWSTWGDKSITWTLSAAVPLKGVAIDWRANSSRRTVFQLQTSPDGAVWTTVYDGAFEGTSATQEVVLSAPRTTRLVRLIGHGDGVSDRATAITDIRFYTYDMRATSPPTPSVRIQSATLGALPDTMVVTQTEKTTVTARNTDGTVADLSGVNMTFRSTNPSVVTVDVDGSVTAVGPGSALVWVQVEKDGVGAYVGSMVSVSDPTRVRLYPTSDAYVESGSLSSRNFGSSALLLVKPPPAGDPEAAFTRYAYMKFDISPLAGADVLQATLGLNASLTEGTKTRLDVHSVVGAWSESTVTWTNRPTLGPTVGSTAVDRTPSVRAADLTSYLQQAVATGRTSASLGITQDTLVDGTVGLRTAIDSRQSEAIPYLDVAIMPRALAVDNASAWYTTAGSPSETIDGNAASYWSTSGDRGITWTLTKAAPVKSAVIDWRANSSGRVAFEVQTSASGGTWTTQYSGEYEGPSGPQTVVLPSAPKSKYVRLTVHGAGPSDPISSISEIRFFDYDRTRAAPPSPPHYIGAVDIGGIPAEMNIGDSAASRTTVTDTTGAALSGPGVSVVYTSSDPAVLSVSASGVVGARTEGAARLTATASYNGDVVTDVVDIVVSDPTRVRIYASADAYVEGGSQSGSNFGTGPTMLIKAVSPEPATGAYVRIGYLKFDLSQLAGANIVSASLTVNGAVIDASTARMRIDVHAVENQWSETGITWINRPSLGASAGGLLVDRTTAYRSVDITNLVRDGAASTAPTLSLGLAQDSPFDGTIGLRAQLSTRESVTRPYVEVVLDLSGG
jgi:hypothetical protein